MELKSVFKLGVSMSELVIFFIVRSGNVRG